MTKWISLRKPAKSSFQVALFFVRESGTEFLLTYCGTDKENVPAVRLPQKRYNASTVVKARRRTSRRDSGSESEQDGGKSLGQQTILRKRARGKKFDSNRKTSERHPTVSQGGV